MSSRIVWLLLLFSLVPAGCGTTSSGTQNSNSNVLDITGNWQIQSSTGSSASSASGVLMLGALKSVGGQVTGTFRFTNLGQPLVCLNQVVTVSGEIDSSSNLTLTSAALPNGGVVTVSLALESDLSNFAHGTIAVTGTACPFASAAAIGAQLAPVTGTFNGVLAPGVLGTPASGTSGTGSLVLKESLSPAADGQFPVTGTLSYTFGTCTGTVALTGDHSGVGINLNGQPTTTAPLAPVIVEGDASPTSASVSILYFNIEPAPCSMSATSSATYSGTLTRQ